jgi:fibronectin type 3 domain-containing protein
LNPPTNLACAGLPNCTVTFLTKPTLTWTATPDTYATGYQVWRSTTSGSGYTQVASVTPRTTTTWTDNTVSALTTYYYVVRAVANSWTSVFTSQVSATVLA